MSGWLKDAPYEDISNDPTDPHLGLVLLNSSQQVAYNVVAKVVPQTQGAVDLASNPEATPFKCISHLPPGRLETIIKFGGYGMNKRFAVEFAFQDSANRSWLRRSSGKLEKIDKDPISYYEVDLSASWEKPES